LSHQIVSTVSLEEAKAPLVLALDLGTSSFRALVFDRDGRAVADTEAQLPHALRTTADGGAESDPDELVDLLVRCVDGALANSGDRAREIAAVGTSCFWHSLLGLDAAGTPVTPLFTWADARSGADAAALRRRLDADSMHARTGCLLHPSYWPAKLAWLGRTDPSTFERVARWCSFAEYADLRLSGEARVSFSMASGTGLLDVHRLDWEGELLAALGVRGSTLSPLVDREEANAALNDDYAARWPDLAAVPWFPALGDGACANVGCGAVAGSRIALTLGTSGAIRVILQTGHCAPPPDLWAYRLDRSHYVLGGALSNGGNLLAWLGELTDVDFGGPTLAAAGALPPDSHGLTLLPFVAGERAPGWYARAAGVVAGLTLATNREHLLRAVMETVAYRFALVYDAVRPFVDDRHEIVAYGGALLRSPDWLQIIADTLGHELLALAPDAEASARGAALVALDAIDALPDLAAAPDPAMDAIRYVPDAGRHAHYRLGLDRQRRLETLLYPDGIAWDQA
jgi:gluconokinase